MTESVLAIPCEGETLLGVLHRGEGTERDLGILIVVGGPQYRVGSHRQFVLMARRWASAGYPVLRFDYRGMGDSSGDQRSFEDVEADIRAALDALFRALPGLRGAVIFGLCDAAAAALMYAGGDGRLQGLILANPWVRTPEGEATSHVRHYYAARILQRSFWEKLLTGRLHVIRSLREFVAAWMLARRRRPEGRRGNFVERMLDGLRRFDLPVLLLISEKDLTAREFEDLCRDSRDWGQAVGRPSVSKVELIDADHTFSAAAAIDRATEVSLAWLARCKSSEFAT